MNQIEHIGMARELISRASQESQNGGNEMIAAEFLWGAFAHCLITVAQNQRHPGPPVNAVKGQTGPGTPPVYLTGTPLN